jgi:hypothetical protein
MTIGDSTKDGADEGDWNTVGAALKLMFPQGTRESDLDGISDFPLLATDLFAVAAHLIERGGVFHRVKRSAAAGRSRIDSKHLVLTKSDIDAWQQIGANLRLAPGDPDSDAKLKIARDSVQEKWNELKSFKNTPVVLPKDGADDSPEWARAAYALLVIADEAAKGIGYLTEHAGQKHPIEQVLLDAMYKGGQTEVRIPGSVKNHVRVKRAMATFTHKANRYVARVLPKSRTATVGNTLRTLTHHLALAPPIGVVDLIWQRELSTISENREPLNLLLVPFPFKVSARCFEPVTRREERVADQWVCNFDVRQLWLKKDGATVENSREEIVDFLMALVASTQREVKKVHGLILPELSLDWPTYDALVKRMLEEIGSKKSGLPDFIVCGSSTDWSRRNGNHVLITTFRPDAGFGVVATTHARAKHHRWRLTGPQIADYALSSSLDPQVVWWEATEIPKREVTLTVFRRDSIFSAMICEDLARSEPCHEPLKAVGPNLVFALLMDGSQLAERWSARYATNLADDPGCSVLTLTSLGLIARTNDAGRHPPTRFISLWKEDTGRIEKISCPADAQAILLTLGGEVAKEWTVDGRMDENTTSWRYQGHHPIRLPKPQDFDWIIKGVDATKSPPASKSRKVRRRRPA